MGDVHLSHRYLPCKSPRKVRNALIAVGDHARFRAFRIQPTSGRLSSETPELRATACAITFGLDALTA